MAATILILLPALTHRDFKVGSALDGLLPASTPVYCCPIQTQAQTQAQAGEASTLQAALAAHPRATVLLHPADAPVAVLTLPPLPTARRDAALRVVLEDRVLGEVQTLALAVQPLGAHRFAVAYCERSNLQGVQHSLQALGASGVRLGALAAHLPADSLQALDDWQLWADAQGAGALPLAVNERQDANPHANHKAAPASLILQASTLAFDQPSSAGSTWARWRWAAYAALACAVVGLAGQFAYWRSLVAADAQAQARINAAFKKALPATPQVDPIKQLQRAATGEGAVATPLAGALSKLPPDLTAAAVTAFEWRAGALTVTLSAKAMGFDEAQKTNFAQSQQASGITVRWGD